MVLDNRLIGIRSNWEPTIRIVKIAIHFSTRNNYEIFEACITFKGLFKSSAFIYAPLLHTQLNFHNALVPMCLGDSEQSWKHNWHYHSNIFTDQTDYIVVVPIIQGTFCNLNQKI